jgi:hypothetical protein
VTGHVNGEVRFWRLNYETGELTVRELMVDIEHRCEITALRVTGVDRQDTLLVGDKSGKMSVCKTTQLENMSSREVAEVTMELRSGLAKVAQEDVGGGLGSGLVKVAQQGKEVGGDIASGIRNLLPGQNPTDNETL